jgi:hypothetical protein
LNSRKCSPICICVLLMMLWNIACFVKNWTKRKISKKKEKQKEYLERNEIDSLKDKP